jgi:hypothetical protein
MKQLIAMVMHLRPSKGTKCLLLTLSVDMRNAPIVPKNLCPILRRYGPPAGGCAYKSKKDKKYFCVPYQHHFISPKMDTSAWRDQTKEPV